MKQPEDNRTLDMFPPDMRYIYFWPDGVWVDMDEYNPAEWSHRGDEYGLLVLPSETTDEQVDFYTTMKTM